MRFDVDLFKGQKTGLFLDQRENREAAARYAHGRLLDCFSYNGGFSLALASRCTALVALEISEDASRHIRENAAKNGVDRLEVRTVNVFDELHELDRADARFDTIVLGSRGLGTFGRMLQGSVSEHVATHARATVVIAR